MASRTLSVTELLSELTNAIKSPMDPYHRKLIRRTITTLNAFVDLVGEPESGSPLPTLPSNYASTKERQALPSLSERIATSESE